MSDSPTLSCQVRLCLQQQLTANGNLTALQKLTQCSAAGMVIADLLGVPKVIVLPSGAVGSFPGTLVGSPSAPTLTPQLPKWVPQPMSFLHRLANIGFWVFGNVVQYRIFGPAYNKVWYALPVEPAHAPWTLVASALQHSCDGAKSTCILQS